MTARRFECMGGPLDGEVHQCLGLQMEVEMLPEVQGLAQAWKPSRYIKPKRGEYRPSPPGTEVTNADGLPIWHWHPSK